MGSSNITAPFTFPSAFTIESLVTETSMSISFLNGAGAVTTVPAPPLVLNTVLLRNVL